MMIFRLLIASSLFSIYCDVNAQNVVKGKIYEAQTDSAIAAVNVYNLNAKRSARSGIDGTYLIAATEDEGLVVTEYFIVI